MTIYATIDDIEDQAKRARSAFHLARTNYHGQRDRALDETERRLRFVIEEAQDVLERIDAMRPVLHPPC